MSSLGTSLGDCCANAITGDTWTWNAEEIEPLGAVASGTGVQAWLLFGPREARVAGTGASARPDLFKNFAEASRKLRSRITPCSVQMDSG
mmetsp:Transcript_62/g.215  ORF Transcript_62/g.215 Transcript_62/m.215 type:complete len:90 (+) Transcript_62:1691-1960(+)